MSKYVFRRLKLGVGRESTRGTGVAPVLWIPLESMSFDEKVVKARSVANLGVLEDSEEAFVTTKYGEGDIAGEIRDQSFGFFLYSLFGSLSTSGPTDSAYTHTFTIENTNQHDSLTLVVIDPNTTEAYRLAMVNNLEITANLDEVVKYSLGFMSKTSIGSGETGNPTTENKFTKKHVSVKVAANRAGLSGASALSIKSLRYNIAQNVVLDDSLGTAEPEDILNQQFSVEGELTLNYEDETWKEYMRGSTDRAMEIKFTNTDATIGSSTRPSLTFTMPKVDFYDWTPNYALDEIVTQTVSFKANYDLANSENSIYEAVLVNTKSSY